MKNELISKTNEQLLNQLKGVRTLIGALIGILTVLLITTTYCIIAQENKMIFIPLLSVVFSCIAILPLQRKSIKAINAELKKRE
ncbi:hypothetical protein EI427_24580 [Flammeovirga pectinis]|uniref:Redox-active disulfide protein 2 n=1 Tax=Flammeovirga pectinis TaxID=2494373 RepID=A0A3Q9FQM6_9BACT|nr:hypothetical protein [Flammeovirga pectinis]AZQ65391.1 hypothetical protein EI427_24580 [Flammeovirga pectinis]